MQKKEWKFGYTGKELATGAKEKFDFHTKRLAWWENKKAEVMTKVKSEGISVQDSVASSVNNYKGGMGPQVIVDATLQRDLTECQGKITVHHDLVNEYAGWIQVLEANEEAELQLNYDDWLFFFGK